MNETLRPLLDALASTRVTPESPTALATVVTVAAGGATVRFDGEGAASTRRYRTLGGAQLVVGARVVMLRVGSTWVVTQTVDDDTGPVAPALQNGWVPYNTAPYLDPRYQKIGGIVWCMGLAKSGTVAAGTLLFTYPAGMRPLSTIQIPTVSNGALALLQVASNGQVTIAAGVSAVNLNLGMSFPAVA